MPDGPSAPRDVLKDVIERAKQPNAPTPLELNKAELTELASKKEQVLAQAKTMTKAELVELQARIYEERTEQGYDQGHTEADKLEEATDKELQAIESAINTLISDADKPKTTDTPPAAPPAAPSEPEPVDPHAQVTDVTQEKPNPAREMFTKAMEGGLAVAAKLWIRFQEMMHSFSPADAASAAAKAQIDGLKKIYDTYVGPIEVRGTVKKLLEAAGSKLTIVKGKLDGYAYSMIETVRQQKIQAQLGGGAADAALRASLEQAITPEIVLNELVDTYLKKHKAEIGEGAVVTLDGIVKNKRPLPLDKAPEQTA